MRPKPALYLSPAQPPLFPGRRPEDLDIKDSVVFDKANPLNRKTVQEVADACWAQNPPIFHPVAGTLYGLTMDGKPDPELYAMARHASFIEVEVGTETGMVDVTRIVCVNDVGHLFNPKGAYAQQYGGAVMGLGRSGTEQHIFCPRTGVALSYDLIGYPIGTMNDDPVAECLINESHPGYAAYGAYGLGENLGAGMSGITVSAIFNATGKRVPDYPTTPDKVLGKIWRTHILQAYLPRLSPRSIMKRNFSNCGTALNPSDPRCRAMNTLLTMGAFQPKIGAIPMDFRRTGIYRQGMDSFFFFRHDKSGPGQFC